MTPKKFIIIGIILITISLTWIILSPIVLPFAENSVEVGAYPGFLAPDFSLETPEGEWVSLAEQEGQPVLVFFWASWCSICKAAMTNLEQTYQTYQAQGFQILAVNVTSQDDLSAAETYFSSSGYTYTMLLDKTGNVAADYQVRAFPTAILIDQNGIVVDVTIGGGLNPTVLGAALNRLFAGEE